MKRMNRRRFLEVAGGWCVATLAISRFPLVARIAGGRSNLVRFRAAVGLPQPPLPSYATQVVEGTLDLKSGAGLVISRVLAGHPGAKSTIGLPGLARRIRIMRIDADGERFRLTGMIEDCAQLRPGESQWSEIIVDRERGLVEAPFLGRQLQLELLSV